MLLELFSVNQMNQINLKKKHYLINKNHYYLLLNKTFYNSIIIRTMPCSM